MTRWIETRKATFKYALGDDFIDKLKTIHALGMDRTDRVSVKGVEVGGEDEDLDIAVEEEASRNAWPIICDTTSPGFPVRGKPLCPGRQCKVQLYSFRLWTFGPRWNNEGFVRCGGRCSPRLR